MLVIVGADELDPFTFAIQGTRVAGHFCDFICQKLYFFIFTNNRTTVVHNTVWKEKYSNIFIIRIRLLCYWLVARFSILFCVVIGDAFVGNIDGHLVHPIS